MSHFSSRRSGFTLVEILVVLAIAALLSSILFAAFRSVSEGNKKASCQNNLVQIYQATRLYSQDFSGESPYLNVGALDTDPSTGQPPQNGLGLWALYGYPASNRLDCDELTSELPTPRDSENEVAPLASYIKTPRLFHCPYDSFNRAAINQTNSGCGVPDGTELKTDVLQYTGNAGEPRLNPYYMSYQGRDDNISSMTPGLDRTLYSSFRAPSSKRQILYFEGTPTSPVVNTQVRSADTTIITWCRFHRDLDANGNTVVNAGNYDNVLFADGTVQYIPTKQTIGSNVCEGWHRLPNERVNDPQYTSLPNCP